MADWTRRLKRKVGGIPTSRLSPRLKLMKAGVPTICWKTVLRRVKEKMNGSIPVPKQTPVRN